MPASRRWARWVLADSGTVGYAGDPAVLVHGGVAGFDLVTRRTVDLYRRLGFRALADLTEHTVRGRQPS